MGLSAAALLLLASIARGQAPASEGYVVKVESGSIILDFSEKSGATPGQPFQIYAEGDELKHPVTGASLGRRENPVAEGSLTQVLAFYSVGAVSSSSGEIKPGMKARLGAKPAAPAAKAGEAPTRAPRWQSGVFDYPAVGLAVADFRGDGSLQIALSDSKTIRLYPYPPKDDKPLAEFTAPGVAPRLLSLEASDLNGDGRAELFATLYNETFARFETRVLELEGGRWKALADIPYVVRGLDDQNGKRILAVQQLVEDTSFPFSNAYPLVFEGGRYGPGKEALRHKRAPWVYEFTNADLDGRGAAFLYLTSADKLRVQFEKGSWKTPDSYGQTPSRVRWQGQLLEFHPPIPVAYDAQKKASLYLVRNTSMLGSLSEPFGLFNGAELARKSWNGLSLADDWTAELGGYCPALAVVGAPAGRELAVLVVGSSGKSSVWIYDP